jgi:uncharacterized HAD superfamily protein
LRKIFIIDIDGVICEHVDNEHPELMSTAHPYPDSIAKINQWHDQGHFVCFFTARTEDHREATLTWLEKHGVKYHKLILGKPRRKEEMSIITLTTLRFDPPDTMESSATW